MTNLARTVGRWVEISTRHLRNAKQECQTLDWYFSTSKVTATTYTASAPSEDPHVT
jgi:hypothetical protein